MSESNGGETERNREILRLAAEAWRSVPRVGEVPVDGESMRPTLRSGVSVVFVPTGDRPVAPGDVVLFVQGDRLVVHRAIRRLPGGLLRTKGDGRVTFDAKPVGEDDLVGRVVAARRRHRTVGLDRPAARAFGRMVAGLSGLVGALGELTRRADGRLRRGLSLESATPFSTMLFWFSHAGFLVLTGVVSPLFHRRAVFPEETVHRSAGTGPVGGSRGVE